MFNLKYLFLISILLLTTNICYAWRTNDTYEIKPKYIDFNQNDNFMDVGTTYNPFIITSNGNTIGEIRPKYLDLTLNDGFMDSGTYSNPYVIEFRN